MARDNGGIIGPVNDPTEFVASGVWPLEEQYQAKLAGNWPLTPFFSENSLRLEESDTDYLYRTPSSSGSQRIFTFSTWLKKVDTSTGVILSSGESDGDPNFAVYFASDKINILFYSGAATVLQYITNAVYRDVSAWYHIVVSVDTTQATGSNRVRLYVNGTEETSFGTETDPSQNTDISINTSSYRTAIGAGVANGDRFSGYLSEVIFVDGQQLDASSFGESNADGVWIPKPYVGTFGTNGFELKFTNAASLGTDSSPNGNDFTINNLTSIDQTTDTPENNYATLNPTIPKYDTPITFSNGNLQVASSGGSTFDGKMFSTLGVSQGKWYAEFKPTAFTTDFHGYGIFATEGGFNESDANGLCRINYAASSPTVYAFGSTVESGLATTSANDILAIALDIDNGTVQFYKNGSTYGNQVTGLSSDFANKTIFFVVLEEAGAGRTFTLQTNFGNPPFTISSGNSDGNGYGNFEYAVPSGYYALNTKNLAEFG